MTPAADASSLLLPLDRARAALFARATRVALLRPLLLEKRRRVPALLLAHAGAALLLSVLAPTLLLVVGPLVLGVPHLISDVRCLVLKPTLSRLTRRLLLGGCAALLLVRALELAGLHSMPRVELSMAALLTLGVVLVAAPRLNSGRVQSALLVTFALAAAALCWPRQARLLLGHGHNLLAVGIWAFMFCRSRSRALGVAAVLLGVTVTLWATPLSWWGFQHGLKSSFGLHAFAAADTLAPGIRNTPLALGIVASFAFLQSVHYAVWLHAIPQEATRGEGTLSFRMSFRALVADFGRPVLLLLGLLVVAVPLAGCVAPLRAQATYLSLSAFHGYLELAALALFWVRADAREPAAQGAPTCS